MKKLILFASILLTSLPAYSQTVYRKTTCNVYYNNMGRVFEGVSCQAWFNNQRLVRVNVYLPHAKHWYDWSTKYSNITQEPRRKECIRHTGKEGNQYQICTQHSPQELGV